VFGVQPGNAGLQRIVSGPDGNLWFTAQNDGPFQITSSGGALWYLETSGEDLFRMT
jgi:hypothetical protein